MRKSVFPRFPFCILHQEALYEKFKNESHYGQINTVNFICASVLYHREFVALLEKVGSEHG